MEKKHTVQFNLLGTIHRLEELRGRRYSYSDIANGAGLNRQGVRYLLQSPPKRIDLETLSKLLDFFAAEGLPITVGDLFTTTTDAQTVNPRG